MHTCRNFCRNFIEDLLNFLHTDYVNHILECTLIFRGKNSFEYCRLFNKATKNGVKMSTMH